MLKKVMRGIKATIHGGTKYERSVKKSLKNDEIPPKEKHLIRIVNGLNDQDDETSLIKAEELMQLKFVEAKDQHLFLQKMKLLLVIDVVADNKYFWKAKDEEKLTKWIHEFFQDKNEENNQININSLDNVQMINAFLLQYSVYVKHKIALLHDLNPYHQNQLSQNTTPLEEFFNCVHHMNEFEDLIVDHFLSPEMVEIAKGNNLIKCIIVNIFATECSLFTSTLVLIALFSERCFSSNPFTLQELIDIINKFSVTSSSEELRKSLSQSLTRATIDFVQVVQNMEKKSAFGKIFKQQYQDLLNEEDPHRTFNKEKKQDKDPFELYQNVYSVQK